MNFGTNTTLRLPGGGATVNSNGNGILPTIAASDTLEFAGSTAMNFYALRTRTPNIKISGSGGVALKAPPVGANDLIMTSTAGPLALYGGNNAFINVLCSGGSITGAASAYFSVSGNVDFSGITGWSSIDNTQFLKFTGTTQTFKSNTSVDLPQITGTATIQCTGGFWATSLGNGGDVWSGILKLGNGFTCTFDSVGTASGYGLSGTLSFDTSTLQIDKSCTEICFNFSQANITAKQGTLVFNAPSGTQQMNTQATTLPGIQHTGASTFQLNTAVTCNSFLNSAGILNVNGHNITTVTTNSVSGAFTINNGTSTTISGSSGSSLNGRTLTVAGATSINGTSGNNLNLNGASGNILTIASTGTLNATYVNMTYCTASVSAGTATNSVNNGNNPAATFPASSMTLYTWVGGTAGPDNWNINSNWSPSSNYPHTSTDSAVFTGAGYPCYLDADETVGAINFASGSSSFYFSSHKLTIAGAGAAAIFSSVNALDGTGTLAFTGTSAQTLTPKSGISFGSTAIIQNGSGGTTVSTNTLTCGTVTLTSGTLTLGAGVSSGTLSFNGGSLNLGSSTYTVTGSGAGISSPGGGSINFNTGTLTLDNAATGNVDFSGISTVSNTSGTFNLAQGSNGSYTFNPKAGQTFPNIVVGGSTSPTQTLTGNLTALSISVQTNATLNLGTGLTHLLTSTTNPFPTAQAL